MSGATDPTGTGVPELADTDPDVELPRGRPERQYPPGTPMPTWRRIGVYRAQTGRHALTPRQAKRVRLKDPLHWREHL